MSIEQLFSSSMHTLSDPQSSLLAKSALESKVAKKWLKNTFSKMFYRDNSLYSDHCLPYHSNMSMDLVRLLTSLLNPFSKNMTRKPTLIHTSFISHKLFI